MYRYLQKDLNLWKASFPRKPLILRGARQVGKTYLLKTWGSASFPNVHYVNFEKTPNIARIFDRDFDVIRILNEFSFHVGATINPKTDLLILDELQLCPKAMTALKYFCEDMPELAIACSASLLGVILSPESFPVGKVNFLNLFPMNFFEFVLASDPKESLRYIPEPSLEATLSPSVHDHLWNLLRQYYVTGGMPEAVAVFSAQKQQNPVSLYQSFQDVRVIQRAIISSYESDFSKHAGSLNAVHLRALYRNIPSQLASVQDESTKRFQFGDVLPNKKGFATWERPIHWLRNAGLALQIKIANHSAIPLEHYCKSNLFKLMPNDIGLLGSLQDLSPAALMDQDFGMAKGYFAECYVAQTLVSTGPADQSQQLYSWQEGESEIEFLHYKDKYPIPIEVKAGKRTRSRSLMQYIKTYNPPLAIRLSRNEFKYDPEKKLAELPLPLAHWIRKL